MKESIKVKYLKVLFSESDGIFLPAITFSIILFAVIGVFIFGLC